MFARIRIFFSDVVTEFKRVSWPTRKNTVQATVVVVFITLLMAVFLGTVDVGLSEAIKHIIG